MVKPSSVALCFILCLSVALVQCGGGSSGEGSGGGSGGGSNLISVSVAPRLAAIVVTQTQQFTATVHNDSAGVVWSVDNVMGGGATIGSITGNGLYTAPASGGSHIIAATSVSDNTKSAAATAAVTGLSGVLTYHNNLARDGTNVQEFALTTSNVKTGTFGKIFSCALDGAAYAQPLWMPSVNVGGTRRNIVVVATQHDSAYAFDADTSPCLQLWHVNLLDSAHGGAAQEIPVPGGDVGTGFMTLQPEIGVTGTPVIDPASKTLYLVSKSEGPPGTFHQRLHGLDVATGGEKFGGPVNISASVAGTGDGASGGSVAFNPRTELQRTALALVNGVVYITWASHEDKDPYHGWVIGYAGDTLARASVLNANPNGARTGIWMSGGAPAADSSGNLYLGTGNGTFDANSATPPNNDFGDSILKISTASGLAVSDWFTPYNQDILDTMDIDLGSSGVVLLPDQSSAHPHLAISGGKEGRMYVLDRDAMGHYCASCTTIDTNVVQSFMASSGVFCTPAFWQNALYFAGSSIGGGNGDHLKRLTFNSATAQFSASPASQSAFTFNFPGATPSVSSQGSSNGIVWVIDSSHSVPNVGFSGGPAVLYAYDATDLGTQLWDSTQASGNRDQAGEALKFIVPTVANGRVYVGTRTELDVYGLLPN
ncbi:MAG: hypothetical protein ACRD23_11600 [Terriglobales bacterium]